ncbi:MAG: zf-HC2 domain-containing protein [Candidatus Rokubacteria bacterium]|nr:zf-HC2 domain-containing protein [Candidatus Rokubacteria bacterium]
MNCHEARELFSAKMDDLLTAEQRAALDGHLQGCADCRREWERFRQTVSLLHSVGEARAPAGFATRVMQASRGEPWHRRLIRNVFLPLHVRLPLEVAALLLVSTLAIFLYRQTPEIQRAVEAPQSGVVAPASEAPSKSAEAEQVQGYTKTEAEPPTAPAPAEEREGTLRGAKDRDQFARKQEAAPASAPPPAVGGRLDAAREVQAPRGQDVQAPRAKDSQKSVPAKPESKAAARAQGPFHLMGLLRPKSPATLDAELNDVVKQAGGILVRDADRVGPGSIVEVVVPRDAYPRLEEGLRRIGDFTIETRAKAFPDQVRIGLRISN